jgi:hypothetical protein
VTAWHLTREHQPPYGVMVWARNGDGKPFKAARILHRTRRIPVWGRADGKGGVKVMRYQPEAWAGIDSPVTPDKPFQEPPAFQEFAKPAKASPSAPVAARATRATSPTRRQAQ